MTNATNPRDFVRLLHELAEGLQATRSYLDTARQLGCEAQAGHASCPDLLDKAAVQLSRAQESYRQLRERLSEKPLRKIFAGSRPASR